MKKLVLSLVCFVSLVSISQASENQTEQNISRYPIPEIKTLPEDIQKIFKGAEKRFGFIPNVLKALAHRPAELKAFLNYYRALNHKNSGLTKKEKEMLIVAHSSANGCLYCVVSHGANLREVSKNPRLSEQVATNYLKAEITPREKAIIAFALKVTNDSKSINENDFKTLRTHGLSNEDIWDVAGITAFFNMSNRLMNFAAVMPNNEYYTKGR